MADDVISRWKRYSRMKKLKRVLNSISFSGPSGTGKIIIGNIRNDRFYTALGYTFAYFFAQCGFQVYVLIDDGLLAHHDNTRLLYTRASAASLVETLKMQFRKIIYSDFVLGIYRFFRDILQRLLEKITHLYDAAHTWLLSEQDNIEFIYYSDIFDSSSIGEERLAARFRQMRDGMITKHVESSHKRRFGGRNFDPLNKQHVDYAQCSIRNVLINQRIAKYLIEEIKPDLYITLDGIYSTFAPIVDTMRECRIPVLFYQTNGFADRTIFIGNGPYTVSNLSKHWENFVVQEYTSEIRDQAVQVMNKRVEYNNKSGDVENELIRLIEHKKSDYKKVVAMFPNLAWDGAIEVRDTIFEGLDAWLKETVAWISDRDILLVIREHPQPKRHYSRFESSLALLREVLPNIDNIENVILIKGTVPLSSYRLIREVVDCSLVYNGTLGVEIPYMGEPVIIAANSPYSHKGVGYEPRSKDEYFDHIIHVSRESEEFKKRREKIRENALIAAAYQFIYNSYYCPLMPTLEAIKKGEYWRSWDLDVDALDPEKNLKWRKTIDRFLEPLIEKHQEKIGCL